MTNIINTDAFVPTASEDPSSPINLDASVDTFSSNNAVASGDDPPSSINPVTSVIPSSSNNHVDSVILSVNPSSSNNSFSTVTLSVNPFSSNNSLSTVTLSVNPSSSINPVVSVIPSSNNSTASVTLSVNPSSSNNSFSPVIPSSNISVDSGNPSSSINPAASADHSPVAPNLFAEEIQKLAETDSFLTDGIAKHPVCNQYAIMSEKKYKKYISVVKECLEKFNPIYKVEKMEFAIIRTDMFRMLFDINLDSNNVNAIVEEVNNASKSFTEALTSINPILSGLILPSLHLGINSSLSLRKFSQKLNHTFTQIIYCVIF